MKIHKCRECSDCQCMISPEGISYRCYGYVKPLYFELKRNICRVGEELPERSPDWCPRKEWDI